MNRKTFFKKLGIGAAAVIFAPTLLIPKEPIIEWNDQVTDFSELLRMRDKLMDDIANIPIS